MRGQTLENGWRGVVLAGDEVQCLGVALSVAFDQRPDLRIGGLERCAAGVGEPRRDRHTATVYARPVRGRRRNRQVHRSTWLVQSGHDEQTQESRVAQTPGESEEGRREAAD